MTRGNVIDITLGEVEPKLQGSEEGQTMKKFFLITLVICFVGMVASAAFAGGQVCVRNESGTVLKVCQEGNCKSNIPLGQEYKCAVEDIEIYYHALFFYKHWTTILASQLADKDKIVVTGIAGKLEYKILHNSCY